MEDPRRLHPVTFFKDSETQDGVKDFRPKRVDTTGDEDAVRNPITSDAGFPITGPTKSNRRVPKD